MHPIDSLVTDVIACYREQFELTRQDISARTPDTLLLVEGTSLLPRQVADILTDANHAIWVIPTAEFQREHYPARAWTREIVEQCENPEAAFDNWMERDVRFAKWIEAEVNALGLRLLKIDGSRTIAETVAEVAGHFRLGTIESPCGTRD
jgi:hypothetical protein